MLKLGMAFWWFSNFTFLYVTLEPEKICKKYLYIQKADKIYYSFYYNHGCIHSLERALTDVIGVRELMTNPVCHELIIHKLIFHVYN